MGNDNVCLFFKLFDDIFCYDSSSYINSNDLIMNGERGVRI